MRLLVVSQYFWPENFRVNDLVAELVKRGHEVTVITGKPNYPLGEIFEAYVNNPEDFQEFSGATILRVPILVRGQGFVRLFINYVSFVFSASLWGIWLLRGRSFDAIFVNQLSPVTIGLPAILFGRIKKVPVVLWVLDLWPETLSAMGVVRSPVVIGLIGRMVGFIYNRCEMVLGQSRRFLPNIAKYGTELKTIRYFPSWSEELFSMIDVEKAPEILEDSEVFTVLFAGNVGEAQDLPAILDAAERLKAYTNIRWVIVGDGRASDWLSAEVKQRGLDGHIFMVGRFPVQRMPSFYAHANALLVSLKRDPVFSMTIPGKVQSYMMSGIPLLGMLDGEGAEVISQSGAGLVCPAGDSGGLANAVLKMSEMSQEQRGKIGQNGRNYAETEFGREILIARLEEYLSDSVELYHSK